MKLKINVSFDKMEEVEEDLLSDSWKVRVAHLRKDLGSLKDRLENKLEKEEPSENQIIVDQINVITKYIQELFVIMDTPSYYVLKRETIRRISEMEVEYYSMILPDERIEEINSELDWNQRMEDTLADMPILIDRMWDENKTEQEIKDEIYSRLKDFYDREEETREETNSIYGQYTFGRDVIVALSETQISRLERKTCMEGTCGICLSDFALDDETIILPKCTHVYHSDCIIPWFRRSVRCPSCRADQR
jgi:hypothetical protein